MARKRLTRPESQARTRTLLIETATRLFLRDGYHATSLDRVAETAGFSKGAVYSNFANKDELCMAVLDQHHAATALALVDQLASAGDSLEGRLQAFEKWWAAMADDHDWPLLSVEFALQGRRNREVRDELTARDRRARLAIAALLEEQAKETGTTLAMPADMLAAALLSLGSGLTIQRLVDRDMPVEVFPATLRLLLQPGGADAAG